MSYGRPGSRGLPRAYPERVPMATAGGSGSGVSVGTGTDRPGIERKGLEMEQGSSSGRGAADL